MTNTLTISKKQLAELKEKGFETTTEENKNRVPQFYCKIVNEKIESIIDTKNKIFVSAGENYSKSTDSYHVSPVVQEEGDTIILQVSKVVEKPIPAKAS